MLYIGLRICPMPIIMLCGLPGSGKTTTGARIRDEAIENGEKAILVSEESFLGADNTLDIVYSDTVKEKTMRSAFLSEIRRILRKDTYVIADGLNYMKGERYQLNMVSRQSKTSSCLVFVSTDENISYKETRYNESVFCDLLYRFEEPTGTNKFEAPYFRNSKDTPVAFKEIYDALNPKKYSKPSKKPKKEIVDSEIGCLDSRINHIVNIVNSSDNKYPCEVVINNITVSISQPLSLFDIRKIKIYLSDQTKNVDISSKDLDFLIVEAITSSKK
eukprot:GHVP01025224.1.p1 GENE.GHVP01025224.1~~GHVP01025224.1.p1  ORF type:complete len:274 (+),score=47.40 GHVP01025224.1:1620-2441(+)